MCPLKHDTLPVAQFIGEQVTPQASPGPFSVAGRDAEHPLDSRWHEWIRIDLAVWVVQRDADLLAAVLEAQHVLDSNVVGQGRRPRRPRVRDGTKPCIVEASEAASVVTRVADDLAPAARRCAGRSGR